MSPLAQRARFALVLFFVLWVANAAFSEWIGGAVVDHAQATYSGLKVGIAPPAEPPQEVRRAAILLLSNLPLFLGLGWIVQGQPPVAGLLFHVLAVFGSIYIPVFLALCLFFLLHPPSSPTELPGVEWADGEAPTESDPDDR